MDVIALTKKLEAIDWETADAPSVLSAMFDRRRLSGWLDSVERAAAVRNQSHQSAEYASGVTDYLVTSARASSRTPRITNLEPSAEEIAEEQELANVAGRTDIGETERTQLTRARRGQGVFRANVRMNESRCRVTGTSDPAHLRASHIKPWRDCNDAEKIHGCNGLLLAPPHIDHLFDRGWISFSDDGELLVASDLDPAVLVAWHVGSVVNAGAFSELQAAFLQHHRTHVFRDGHA